MDPKSEFTRSHDSILLDPKQESIRSHKRGLSVSFAERTDVMGDTKNAITESMKTMEGTGKLMWVQLKLLIITMLLL